MTGVALEALPPCSLEAEQAVIGSLLVDPDCRSVVDSLLDAEGVWFWDKHRWIHNAVIELTDAGQRVDLVTVAQQLERDGLLADVEPAYLAQLIAGTPTSLHATYYAAIVREMHQRRRTIAFGSRLVAAASSLDIPLDGTLTAGTDWLLRSAGATVDEPTLRPLDDILRTVRSEMTEQKLAGVPTGFLDLDRLTGGLRPGTLALIAGRPSMGKSALGLTMAMNAAKAGTPTVFFSMEMSSEECVRRWVSQLSGVDGRRLTSGELGKDELAKADAAIVQLGGLPIHIDDQTSYTIEQMRGTIRRLRQAGQCELVLLDYVQLMHGHRSKSTPRHEELAEISKSLKALAREFKLPVVALTQLSRAVEARTSGRPMLSDLRESGQLEQDADVVVFLHREDVRYTESQWGAKFPNVPYPRGLVDLIVAKQRNGPTGDCVLLFHEHATKFTNFEPGARPPDDDLTFPDDPANPALPF